MLFELLIIIVLVLLNGFLALSELALVSARPARLRAKAERGVRGAAPALRLVATPGAFLSPVQIGITLVGVAAGAVSGATLGTRLAEWLSATGISPTLAPKLGVGVVVIAITYVTIVIGELVPKRIALADPERTACRVAPAMLFLSRITKPIVWILDRSSKAVLAILGFSERRGASVSEEDIHSLISEARDAGIIEKEETEMIGGVMRLADRRASGLMTPAHEVEFAQAEETRDALLERFRESGHSR
jgi:putative hemolysin